MLRERKRHTARRVASARYPALSHGGGVPHPDLAGGMLDTPHVIPDLAGGGTWVPHTIQTWPRGTLGTSPPSRPDWGVPPPSRPGWGTRPLSAGWGAPTIPDLAGVPPPPIQTWDGVPPISWMGYPHPDLGLDTPPTKTCDGVPPRHVMGYPPPRRGVN